ncbi:hypothetical protein [Devosia sp. FJ2-5-3]|uniref:hypothetical protein n=1 Tax=Devosia sp. FJ2-5-3 TaxID=2976680 RepID=UPI0023D8878E|nr:hypothetical protein [Devosia sp. FJ2-5-3]WEJ60233.1 hypothetical protein N0P34_09425 [Devosia sp. FJ2-5-3]
MSIFAQYERIVSTHIDGVFGDPVEFHPKKRGEVSVVDDPIRPKRNLVGIVDFNPRVTPAKGKEQYDAFQPDLAAEKVHVSFDIASFTSRADWPQQGDHLIARLKDGVHRLDVIAAQPDEVGRLVCPCKLLKSE